MVGTPGVEHAGKDDCEGIKPDCHSQQSLVVKLN